METFYFSDSDALRQTISSQEALLRNQLLGNLMENSVSLARQVSDFSAQLPAITAQLSQLTVSQPPSSPLVAAKPVVTSSGPPASRVPHTVDPEPYSGEPHKCKPSLLQCSLVLGQKPFSYATDETRVQFVVGLLCGRALNWTTALWEGPSVFFKS